MRFDKSPPELTEFFNRLTAEFPDVEHKKIFGYPAIFMNGNMVAGLHGHTMMIRLGEEKRLAFLEQEQAHIFEPMPGHRMREYVVIPEDLLKDENRLIDWLNESRIYVHSLPPKIKKGKKQ